MTYDIDSVRADFPALADGSAHFDGPGGTQTPTPVIDAIAGALRGPLSNRGTLTAGESRAEQTVADARGAIADLVGGDPGGVVFGRSATQLCYDFSRWISRSWGAGDEVVVTRLDHDSNVRPWVQAAERTGARVRWLDFDPETSELDDVATVLSDRTRLVAVTGASNLIGTKPPVASIAAAAHAAGALVYLDGVHLTAHASIDLAALGADLFACSPYKFLGPHLGALAASPALLDSLIPDKLLPSTNAVPERFEFGTLPYELLAGVAAAVDYLSTIGYPASSGSGPAGTRREKLVASLARLEEYEDALLTRLEDGIRSLPGVSVHSRAAHRTPTLLLTIEGRDTVDAYEFLAGRGVDAPSSNFYALEASRRLGLGDAGGLRVGLAPYTNADDVDRLLASLDAFLAA
ncbi:cysteine desulfurase family protein (TIGR01976 family) [Cryobacterium mesophilum]|uniref:Cysteine desulfurase-like protein n=1 Tax=Terrimesophilobacter mesophilus TaxID=433647 RepID=A0A4R8VC36_9MICO|nr:cysteine desulfurase-like protein [Terrimesophilobacter mesophilus]MBB5633231.1 cysteine desulfurase family protein (TIGR01976 family) [Terrimesophilobacter mesophilus]TFB79976.1 cysteine desulfurase-like protein [Terrimesophilobacter mesophilus]